MKTAEIITNSSHSEEIHKARMNNINYLNLLENEELSNKGLYLGLSFGVFASILANIFYEELIKNLSPILKIIFSLIMIALLILIIDIGLRNTIKLKARKTLTRMNLRDLDYIEEYERSKKQYPEKYNESLQKSGQEINQIDKKIKKSNQQREFLLKKAGWL